MKTTPHTRVPHTFNGSGLRGLAELFLVDTVCP